MSLLWFGKKKKFPDIPKKPEVGEIKLPNLLKNNFEFPTYTSEPMKNEAKNIFQDGFEPEEVKIPLRKKTIIPIKSDPKNLYLEDNFKSRVKEFKNPKEDYAEVRNVEKQNGHMFVEIEHYKEALDNLEKINEKITEAETMLDDISKLRSEEEKELYEWRNSLKIIKEKLLDVDNKLFK